ncbi:MAG TPA: ATP-binding protein [Miltoncostaeaceae bacterium]|nr:ATP-binding protein [Miltoncostaeaceae bacterium]
MRQFFDQNETIILFAHGLVFFSLGFAVWLQRRRASRLALTNALIWLAAFAFIEAFAVWGRAFVPIQRSYLEEDLVDSLVVLRGVIQTAAFLFLVQFGLRLLPLTARARTALTSASVALWAGILVGGALLAGGEGWSVEQWEWSVVAACRLMLLLPGAALAGVGVWRQRGELAAAGMIGIKPYAAATAGVLGVYAVLGGLVIDPAPWAGAAINEGDFFRATGLPLATMRGLAGLALCVLAVKLLEIFEVEAKQRLDALERSRAVAEERARFRRDLHDGTIQSIYAAGLHLEAIALRCEEAGMRGEVRSVVADLNHVTDDIRRYITDLSEMPDTPAAVADRLRELSSEFSAETSLDVRVRVSGLATSGPMPDGAGRHLEQILREALSNAARHAGGCSLEVLLSFAPDEFELRVRDDGCGMRAGAAADHDGHGLRNMRERARRLGGRLTIDSDAAGTRVVVAVPLDAEVVDPAPLHRTFPEVITS